MLSEETGTPAVETPRGTLVGSVSWFPSGMPSSAGRWRDNVIYSVLRAEVSLARRPITVERI